MSANVGTALGASGVFAGGGGGSCHGGASTVAASGAAGGGRGSLGVSGTGLAATGAAANTGSGGGGGGLSQGSGAGGSGIVVVKWNGAATYTGPTLVKRFYFAPSAVPDVSPAQSPLWATAIGWKRQLLTAVDNVAGGSFQKTKTTTGAPQDLGHFQFTSPPIKAATISGSFTLAIGGWENDPTMDAFLQATIFVVSNDGLTVRGTLYAGQSATTASATVTDPNAEFDPTAANRSRVLSGVTLSSVTVQEGDRLVVEVGYRSCNSAALSSVVLPLENRSIGTDLPATANANGDVGINRPWIEFSNWIAMA